MFHSISRKAALLLGALLLPIAAQAHDHHRGPDFRMPPPPRHYYAPPAPVYYYPAEPVVVYDSPRYVEPPRQVYYYEEPRPVYREVRPEPRHHRGSRISVGVDLPPVYIRLH